VKILRSTLLILLIAFTFLGNVGLRVFTHSCEEDGVYRSYFVELQDHCEDKKKEVLPPCCRKEKAASCGEKMEDDCCKDQIDVYKINLDFYTEYHVETPDLAVSELPVFNWFSILSDVAEYDPEHYIHPPPRRSGKQILIANQVFRI
jgi:hypothetical protein